MALPLIKTPEYSMIVPSTGEEVIYRPFLVGEEKILLLAMEGEDENDIKNAVMKLVNSCTFGKIGTPTDPMFDIEFAFLRIRGKSVSENIELSLTCPDDNETVVKFNLDTELVEVAVQQDHTNRIELNDDFTIVMRYPVLKDSLNSFSSDTEKFFDLMKNCIEEIHHGEDVYNTIDISTKEKNNFFDSMTQGMLEKIKDFFVTMPKLRHVIEIKNPKTKKKSEVVLEGLSDFFG